MEIRPEYPRPQFQRDAWINLNGPWSYEFDFGESGTEHGRQRFKSTGFDETILVPFCPESELSGVGYKDFIPAMWYHRTLDIPADWAGQDVLLQFGGVDYECEAYINGQSVGLHYGGTVSFSFDLTRYVEAGQSFDLVVRVQDHCKNPSFQPRGKQSGEFASRGCHYTRTTGIWQTVWLEAVAPAGLSNVQIIPDLDNSCFVVTPTFRTEKQGLTFQVSLDDASAKAKKRIAAQNGSPVILELDNPTPWSPERPHLYPILCEVLDGETVLDTVHTYAGLRKVHIEGDRVYLNNKPFYQRLVLDQGFYPEGIWTAPSDEALRADIELSKAAGFNGARLHQKVFEERFHYWADVLGYITWGETSSWGCDVSDAVSSGYMLQEWREIVLRDRNHPSIITWTPFNETWENTTPAQHSRSHRNAYEIAHALDPTRPVNDTSGFRHVVTDLWTVHTYEQDPAKLLEKLSKDAEGNVWKVIEDEPDYTGQPYLVSEFGGIKWWPRDQIVHDIRDSWGYGESPKSLEEFYARLEGLVDAMLAIPHISGYCYTQLTDVEQEQNGIYYYDRTEKFDMARIRAIFSKEPS